MIDNLQTKLLQEILKALQDINESIKKFEEFYASEHGWSKHED